ncbi:MAG: YkgJ family cysteine cluster protein [Candidatus Omnitrophica bacterium]|nr:YkgJ family cysteine cluster protein [Candidatus Omnitrophota bacterium]
MLKQLIPQEVCLKCRNCCRFSSSDSVWSPCLLEEEIQNLIDRKDIPAVSISIDKRIVPVLSPEGEGFICPLLNIRENKCRIYEFRPFECQLYPFLLSVRRRKVMLTVDLSCPYVKEKISTSEFKEYIEELSRFLNSPAQKRIILDNPQILVSYEGILEIIELGPEDASK